MKLKHGVLLTIDSPDLSGKSTQIPKLVAILENAGYDVVPSREPGGTPLAEKIRDLLLGNVYNPVAELLLFAAARAEHLHTKILPAMARGAVVVCDRFADSTFAYQGYGRGYVEEVSQLEEFVLKDFEPNYTLFFDIPLEETERRLLARVDEINHLDLELKEFKERVYAGYKYRFEKHRGRMHRIDAMGTVDEVTQRVTTWVNKVFIPRNPLR